MKIRLETRCGCTKELEIPALVPTFNAPLVLQPVIHEPEQKATLADIHRTFECTWVEENGVVMAHNSLVLQNLQRRPADTATLCNVLCVIKDGYNPFVFNNLQTKEIWAP
jgi:hypothetical protein